MYPECLRNVSRHVCRMCVAMCVLGVMAWLCCSDGVRPLEPGPAGRLLLVSMGRRVARVAGAAPSWWGCEDPWLTTVIVHDIAQFAAGHAGTSRWMYINVEATLAKGMLSLYVWFLPLPTTPPLLPLLLVHAGMCHPCRVGCGRAAQAHVGGRQAAQQRCAAAAWRECGHRRSGWGAGRRGWGRERGRQACGGAGRPAE